MAATRATLQTLAGHIGADESARLRAQLPEEAGRFLAAASDVVRGSGERLDSDECVRLTDDFQRLLEGAEAKMLRGRCARLRRRALQRLPGALASVTGRARVACAATTARARGRRRWATIAGRVRRRDRRGNRSRRGRRAAMALQSREPRASRTMLCDKRPSSPEAICAKIPVFGHTQSSRRHVPCLTKRP